MDAFVDLIAYFFSGTSAIFTVLWFVSFMIILGGRWGQIPALITGLISSAVLGGFALIVYAICSVDDCFSPAPIFVTIVMGAATIGAFGTTRSKRTGRGSLQKPAS